MIYLEALSALILVLGLIGLFYYLGQRLNERVNGGASKRQVKVIERTPLGDKRALLLVRVGEQQILLGATGSTISMLSTIPLEETPAEAPVSKKEEQKPEMSKASFRKSLEAIR
jgi:flagellar biosynthetic protein FliO